MVPETGQLKHAGRRGGSDDACGAAGRFPLRFDLALPLDDQGFQLRFFGGGEVFDFRHLRCDVTALGIGDGDQVLPLLRERAQLIARSALRFFLLRERRLRGFQVGLRARHFMFRGLA